MSDGQATLSAAALTAHQRADLPVEESRFRVFWRKFRRNRLALTGFCIIAAFVVIAIIGPWIAPYDPLAQDLPAQLQGPSRAHWLGTDEFGRDLLSRIIVGTRVSLTVGIIATGIGAGIGTAIGLCAGYFRRLDGFLMRLMDVLLAFPSILLAIAVIAVLGPSLFNVMIAVGIRSIPSFARLVRSAVLSIRTQEYVEAARACGCRETVILGRHIVPNCLNTIVVFASLQIGEAILSAAILSFLGLGVQPPTPEWGQMVNAGRGFLRDAPHITTFPGLALFLVVMGFNLAGDGIRDALDPRHKGR